MITAIIISNGIKQLMLTPENDADRLALSLFATDDTVEVAIRKGSFAEKDYTSGFKIDLCRGDYLRGFASENTVMLVMKPKVTDDKKD